MSEDQKDKKKDSAAEASKKPQTPAASPNEFKDQFKELNVDADSILLLEDSPPNRNILKSILVKLGYQVIVAENGSEGFKSLDIIVEKKLKVVLVISDVMMPEVDGLEFLEKVRSHKAFSNIPFLFVTALADRNSVSAAATLGVAGYLLKPVSMEQIKAKLKALFPKKQFPTPRFKKTA